jgi:Leucine-rich repeat (LRR) protein
MFRTQLLSHSITLNHLHRLIFAGFPNLRAIHLQNANLRFLDLGDCAGLTSFYSWGNLFTSIPSRTFQNCGNLTSLELWNNEIVTTFEDSFKSMTSLRTFDVMGNPNIDISRTSLSDSSLTTFRFIGAGRIEVGALSHMTSLTRVQIWNNQSDFGYFENMLRGINNLITLDLSSNGLVQINFDFLAGFSRLSILFLDNNKLSSFPVGAFQELNLLITLGLNDNLLSDLDENTFSGLQALSLYLDGNSISDLSRNPFGGLDSLDLLSLRRNQVADLAGVTFPINLLTLNLESNRISTIGPQSFVNLPNLETLRMANNQIVRLNSNAFENVRNLTTLNVVNNSLDSIEPNFFQQFPMLTLFEARINYCIDEDVSDVNSVDLDNENVFSVCFHNWQHGTTTPGSGAALKFKTLTLVIALILLKFH